MSPVRRIKLKIGELLLQKGIITAEQLYQALTLQRNSDKYKDKPLGEILSELAFVSQEDLYLLLAIQSGYPYLDISHCAIDKEVLALIPESLARKYKLMPIDKIKDILTIAMVNPLDNEAREVVQNISQCQIKVFLTTFTELKEAAAKGYGPKLIYSLT